MASSKSIFPIRGEVQMDTSPETVSLSDAGDLVDALQTGTARSLVSRIYESPATASDLAETSETSLQNVKYHLDKLCEVGIIEVVDTWYSERGKEMDVYGPANEPLVIVAGPTENESEIRQLVSDSSSTTPAEADSRMGRYQ